MACVVYVASWITTCFILRQVKPHFPGMENVIVTSCLYLEFYKFSIKTPT